jgi:hypothetical protein
MKRLGCLILLALSLCVLVTSTVISEVYGEPSKEIRGQVLDEEGNPLQNATVAFWQVEEAEPFEVWTGETWRPPLHVRGFLETATLTDANGSFTVKLNQTASWSYGYRVYVYTEDFRYVPLVSRYTDLWDVPEDLSFQLTVGASIILDSEVLIVNSTVPWQSPDWLIFQVNPIPRDAVYTYCDPTESYFGEAHSCFLGLEPRRVIVPANTPVEIRVKWVTSYSWTPIPFFPYIYELVPTFEAFNISQLPMLKQGQELHIDVREYSLQYNSLVVQDLLEHVESLLEQCEQKGFYVLAEQRDLKRSRNLLISAESERLEGFYTDSYVDVLEAYQIGSQLVERIDDMFLDATGSAIFFPPFFAFTAVVLASLLFESKKLKALTASIAYVLLITSFYFLYPGSRLADTSLLVGSSIGFMGVTLVFSFVFPHLVKRFSLERRITLGGAIVALSSLAKRSMKRRRLRSMLTLVVVTIAIAAFIALTSVSMEYGLMVTSGSRSPPAEGLLVRAAHPLPSPYRELLGYEIPFAPMRESELEWLAARNGTILVAPRAENTPQRVVRFVEQHRIREDYKPLGSLAFSQNTKMGFSVVGIVPTAEASATHLDSCVKSGRYLNDDDSNAILLSEKAASELGVQIGDELLWTDQTHLGRVLPLRLVGVLEDSSIDNLRDLDGQPFLHTCQKILEEWRQIDGYHASRSSMPCSPDEVIITNYRSAYNFSDFVFLSRVNVLVGNPEILASLSRELAWMRNFWVWASIGEDLYRYQLDAYAELGGSGIIIAFTIVMLTIGTTTSASVYDRRHEMNIMSAVGLNPFHITMLFVDQAVIIGVIGGAIGYLLGTGLYQVFILFPLDIVVRQKLSLSWSFVALAIGVVASTLGAAIPAVKASVLVTPSLLRRWKIERKPSSAEEPYIFEMPVKIRKDDVNDFVNDLVKYLQDHTEGAPYSIRRVRRTYEQTPEATITHIMFTYSFLSHVSSFLAANDISIILKKDADVGIMQLASTGAGPDEEKHIHKIASLIRNFTFEWISKRYVRVR